jgi:hypothetical protein
MTIRKMLAITLILATFSLIFSGCNNHFVQATGPDFSIAGNSPDYFSLGEGFTTTYVISSKYGSSETITYTVGKQISFLTGTAIEWISNKDGEIDTGYFVYANNSLLFYESKKSQPQVVLSEPLTVGSSWSRFVSDDTDGQLDDTTTVDIQDKGETDNSGGGVLQVSYPVEGSEMLTVDKIETVELSRIGIFSKVIRISNDTQNGAKNYYWYAANVGMIKYVLGATSSDDPRGNIEAELVYYGNAN